MNEVNKKAFVLMPFRLPFNSYYPAIFKPALEAAGYTVTRADDLFTPRPIMLDIQKSILEADLLLCEMSDRNPNVFYELGLAHAIGKPAILISRKEDDIPFDLRHLRVILYDYTEAGWESKLRDNIKAAAQAVATSDEIWPPPLIAQQENLAAIRALSSEIDFNLHEIDRFLARNYRVIDNKIMAGGKRGVTFRYITCVTSVFESNDVQQALQSIQEDIKSRLIGIYHSFREINDKADALKKAFRPWRALHYIEAINEFNNTLRSDAEKLQEDLLRLGL
ncbi:MAG: hypothetical protein KAW19_06135 [Candidatus Aminicenantes bacterium]|nr:hypothetical protein [Candidatus Aminicenantes bacterium]